MPILKGSDFVLASHNPGKLAEFQRAFSSHAVKVQSAADLELEEPEETGLTFEDNAILKAKYVADASGKPSLADDSGLVVYGLEGAPGIYSARWAGPEKDFTAAMERVGRMLKDKGSEDVSAAFVCVLAMAWPDGRVEVAEGRVEGTLVFPGRGEGGFGYDPIFIPNGENRTFGEMTPEDKARYSHRMRALDALMPKIL